MLTDFSIQNSCTRRDFLSKTLLASGAVLLGGNTFGQKLFWNPKPNSKIAGVQIGTITYSYRSMPHTIEQLLQYIVESGISAVELMGDAVEEYAGKPANKDEVAAWRAGVGMKKFKEVKKMFNKAGVGIYAFKPSALGPQNTDAEVEYALKVAKVLGARSVTVEIPKDPVQSKRLGDLATKHKVFIGYHNHTQGNDQAWLTALSQSPYNSINLDCGHYIAAGGNNTKESLLAFIEANHTRITSMHMKDRQTKEKGAANLPWGEGDTPIREILQLLKAKKYDIPVSIELEYTIPAGSTAVKEVNRCFEYAKNALLS